MADRLVATVNSFWANRSLRTKAMALLLVPLPILMAAMAGLYRTQKNEQEALVWVRHTQEVRSGIQDTLIRLLDAEASARDFLLAGEQPALEHFWESRQLLALSAEQLAAMVEDNPPQFHRAGEVRELIQNELAALSALCQNRSSSDRRTPQEMGGFVLLEGGRDLAAHARIKLTAMQMEEDRLLQARAQYAEGARWRLLTLLSESIIAGLFFQMAAALLLTGTVSGQIRAVENNARLFWQGGPIKDVVADSREFRDLAHGLRQAAAMLTDNEHALRESEERFRTLFKEAPIAYHEIDRDGVIRHVNLADCALLGREPEQIIGKHAWDLVARDSQDVVRQNILDRLAGVRPTTPYECDFECLDLSLVTVEIHENLIHDKQGAVTGIRSALLDVTARKMVGMAVRKVEQYAQELKTKNEELLLALGTAREASAAKGRFLAAMSHELRTPLNGIIGLTELMFDGVTGEVSDEQKEYLGDILASSRHLLQLVNDILDLAKVESGKMDFRREAVEIAPLLREVRDVLRILADKKRITIRIDAGKVDTVVTDPARLKQVVYNYLSNAIKFTVDSGTIQVRARWEAAHAFRIEVEDTGPGIPDDDIPRLFADFQQLDSARPVLGTGLGLALTKRIVEGQGGVVGVRSHPGLGSVFFAVFPVEFDPERAPTPQEAGAGQEASASTGPAADPARQGLESALHI